MVESGERLLTNVEPVVHAGVNFTTILQPERLWSIYWNRVTSFVSRAVVAKRTYWALLRGAGFGQFMHWFDHVFNSTEFSTHSVLFALTSTAKALGLTTLAGWITAHVGQVSFAAILSKVVATCLAVAHIPLGLHWLVIICLIIALKIGAAHTYIKFRQLLSRWLGWEECGVVEETGICITNPEVWAFAVIFRMWGRSAPVPDVEDTMPTDLAPYWDNVLMPNQRATPVEVAAIDTARQELVDYVNSRQNFTSRGYALAQQGILRAASVGHAFENLELDGIHAVVSCIRRRRRVLDGEPTISGEGWGDPTKCMNWPFCQERVGRRRKKKRTMRCVIAAGAPTQCTPEWGW